MRIKIPLIFSDVNFFANKIEKINKFRWKRTSASRVTYRQGWIIAVVVMRIGGKSLEVIIRLLGRKGRRWKTIRCVLRCQRRAGSRAGQLIIWIFQFKHMKNFLAPLRDEILYQIWFCWKVCTCFSDGISLGISVFKTNKMDRE